MSITTQDIIRKTEDGIAPDRNELLHLLALSPDSAESYMVMAEARRISRELTDNRAEIHGQFALNISPCTCNCLFCSFAKVNGIFNEDMMLSPEEAVRYAKQFENSGANAVFVMVTAQYPLGRFIEMSQEIRKNLKTETLMVANLGDQNPDGAKKLKDAGYTGVYHALRFREGKETNLSPEKRKESIRNFQEAGLKVGTCVEPVGPEHSNEEIADLIEFTASINPAFSGAARRITIPGTRMAERGMISEIRMAQIVAVTRLGMPRSVKGNCTHEPCTLGAAAGANLFWAELGANPRDTEAKTEEGRGDTVEHCRTLFNESGWDVLSGQSKYYGK